MEKIKVLAVADPAVYAYVNQTYHILDSYNTEKLSVFFDIIPWESYYSKMMDVLEGKEEYDIVMVAGHLWLADLVSKNYLATLDYEDEDILPVIMDEMKYDGTAYLSPSFCDGHMIVYRKSIVKQVFEDFPNEVLAVDDFIALVHQLNSANFSPSVALKAHPSEIFLDALPYLRSSTQDDVYAKNNDQVECHIDRMQLGLEKYLNLKDLAAVNSHQYGNEEIKNAIVNQEVPMATTWSGQLGEVYRAEMNPCDLGFSTFETSWNVTWSFAVVGKSKKQEQAKALLSYLRSPLVDEMVGDYSGAPIRKSTYLKGQDKYPWYNTQLQMIEKYAKPLIDIIGAGDKNGALYEEIFNAFIGEKTAFEAVKDAKDRVEERK